MEVQRSLSANENNNTCTKHGIYMDTLDAAVPSCLGNLACLLLLNFYLSLQENCFDWINAIQSDDIFENFMTIKCSNV